LTSLVKKLDAATSENAGARMGSFIVFCSDEEGLEAKLKELAKKEELTKIVLTISITPPAQTKTPARSIRGSGRTTEAPAMAASAARPNSPAAGV
jgi:hypothetical protein